MNTKKLISLLLFLFGEAIIIASFILFGKNTPSNILILNIIISSLVFGLFFFGYSAPWIDLKDKTQKQVGSLGVSWLFIWLYFFLAAGLLIAGYFVPELTFKVQLVFHCALLFLFLLGQYAASRSAAKVAEVYEQETKNRDGINDMKAAMRQLKNKMAELNGLPEWFTQRVDAFDEGVRFLSPTNSKEACELEKSFVEIVNGLLFAITDFSMNEAQIESTLKKLDRLFQNRKNIYSN